MDRTKISTFMGQKIKKILQAPLAWILLALFVRLIFIYPQYSGDTLTLVAWGQAVGQNSYHIFQQTFQGIGSPNYPPIILLLLGISSKLYSVAFQVADFAHFQLHFFPGRLFLLFTNFNMSAAFIKIFPILSDLGIGYLIYIWQKKSKFALLYMLLYLFNPAVIYISSVWGQIESVTLFSLLLSLILSQSKVQKYQYLSHLAFIVAVLTKQTALWLLPIYIILWLKQSNVRVLLVGLFLQAVLFFVSYLPFGYLPWQSPQVFISTLSGSSNFVADSAWNIWYWIFGGAKISDNVLLGPISVRIWSIMLLGLIYVATCLWLFKKYSKNNIAWALFLIAIADFFIQTRVHERHLAPALVFLLLIAFRKKVLGYLLFFLLSMYHLVNLMWSLRLSFI